MARVKGGMISKARHKKILSLTKGFRGRAKNCYRIAAKKAAKALQYAYRDRRTKKRTFRALWIQRINAAARARGITYSELINGLSKANIIIDRKVLSDLAVKNEAAFEAIIENVKTYLQNTSM